MYHVPSVSSRQAIVVLLMNISLSGRMYISNYIYNSNPGMGAVTAASSSLWIFFIIYNMCRVLVWDRECY